MNISMRTRVTILHLEVQITINNRKAQYILPLNLILRYIKIAGLNTQVIKFQFTNLPLLHLLSILHSVTFCKTSRWLGSLLYWVSKLKAGPLKLKPNYSFIKKPLHKTLVPQNTLVNS